ncbi:MAG: hypothetical protein R3B54_17585 [Bdellovibrionota bacterium]
MKSGDDEGIALLAKIFGETSGAPAVASNAASFSSSLTAVLENKRPLSKASFPISMRSRRLPYASSAVALAQAISTSGPVVGNNAFINSISTARTALGVTNSPLRQPSIAAGSTRTNRYAIVTPLAPIQRAPASFAGTPHRDTPAAETLNSSLFDKSHKKK